MTISLSHRLAYVSVRIVHGERTLDLSDVVLDTGSSGTAFSVEALTRIGILQEMQDTVSTVHGIGGTMALCAGKLVTYTVRDQFGNAMAGNTAMWSEWRYLVQGDPNMIGSATQNQPMDGNGQDLDAHAAGIPLPTNQQWTCAIPDETNQWVEFDQRITINGWGAGACADVSSHLPAFWRFRVKKWLGEDQNGNPATTATVGAW